MIELEKYGVTFPNPFKDHRIRFRSQPKTVPSRRPSSQVKCHWRSSVPTGWVQLLGEDKIVTSQKKKSRRNSLSYMEETHKFINKQVFKRSPYAEIVPSKFRRKPFPLETVTIYMRRNSLSMY